VVGAGGNGNTVYYVDNDFTVLSQSLPMPDSAFSPVYVTLPYGSFTSYDIAYEGYANDNGTGDIWLATNVVDSPIRAYNTSGALTYATNIIPTALGLGFYSAGNQRYLWASCPSDGKIYLIALDPLGVEGDEGGTTPSGLTSSANPFLESVTIAGTGFGPDATIEIFDISGRSVVENPFTGTFTWRGASVPSGVYYVRVTDPSGTIQRLTVAKL
jgi:hypothetical protein